MTDPTIRTYRVTDDRATVRDAPLGRQIRRMVRDELFQGRPAPGRPDWIMRTEDGITPRGYVKASVCAPLDLPASMRLVADLLPPDAVGETVDRLATWLAYGRSRDRATAIRALFGDFAAAVIGAASSQAASVMNHLIARQTKTEARIQELERGLVELRMELAARERAVGE